MKFAIIGAGVAGSYLGHIIDRMGHDVTVFEMSKEGHHWPVCAWGAPKQAIEAYISKAHLNANDYILYDSGILELRSHNNTDGLIVSVDGFVTFDKQKWEHDLLANLHVVYGSRSTITNFPVDNYNYILDCTGVHRSMLPKGQDDFTIPSFEFLVENVCEENKFVVMNYENARGYFWYFPLDSNKGFVGAGDTLRRYDGIAQFFAKHPEARILRKIGRPIRVSPPSRMEPFYDGKIIGVGESIGSVFPLTGEGIVPSLLCCDILLDNLDGTEIDVGSYRTAVLQTFDHYEYAFRVLKIAMRDDSSEFVNKVGDLKALISNDVLSKSKIKNASDKFELLVAIFNSSHRFNYPIPSFYNFYIRLKEVIKIADIEDILYLMPAYYFPIMSITDFEDKILALFIAVCNGSINGI